MEYIHYIQQFRNPHLDAFFKFLDFFDRQEFFFILIPLIWLGVGWKSGLRLFYILFFSALSNQALKAIFAEPRPFILDPSVGIIHVSGYSFPSGAAQTAVLLAGILIVSWKNPWKWPLAISYFLLISFSRVYLGVHYPQDIIGGWLIGALLLLFYIYLYPIIEEKLEKWSSTTLFLASQFPLVFLWGIYTPVTIVTCSFAIALGWGVWIDHFYGLLLTSPKNNIESILRASVGILGMFGCYSLTLLFPDTSLFLFIRFFLLGLWISVGSHFVCRVFRRF